MPPPGQDRYRLAGVGVEGEKGVTQQNGGFRVDGIARFGETIDRNDGDRPLFLDRDLGHGAPFG